MSNHEMMTEGSQSHGQSPHGRPHAEEGHHEPTATAEHLAHYAHRLHLVVETLEKGEHHVHHWAGHAKEVQAARKLAKAHAQMAFDLRRMNRGLGALEKASRQGGATSAKLSAQLTKARASVAAAKRAFESERGSVGAAEKLIRAAAAGRKTATGLMAQRIGQAAVKFTAALNGSRVGRMLLTTGRIAASKAVVHGLFAVGVALDAYVAYEESPAQTQGGKLANGVLGAGASALVMARLPVAAADMALPKGYKLGEVYRGTADALTSIGEGLVTGDTRAMDEFHRRAMQGAYGKLMVAASEAGEYWERQGVRGGLREFEDALLWWVSQ